MSQSAAGFPGSKGAATPPRVTPEIAAEAALWVARLHGPDRNAEMDREFQAWQALSAAHREAFGKCTEVWQDVPRVRVADAYEAVSSSRRGSSGAFGGAWRWAAAAVVVGLLSGSAVLFAQWMDRGAYDTSVGEQRLIVLEDGSRMLLNTGTKVRVDFRRSQRAVEVASGEALFEVAKDPGRPFVVRAAGSEIVAVGTAFSVRFDGGAASKDALSITLIEGRVDVRPAPERGADSLAPQKAVALQPGERLLLDHGKLTSSSSVESKLDRPNVEQVIAWKRREAVFQESSLADAVSEMNRYNRTPVVLSSELRSEALRVSGVFRTGDSAGFARAVAALHGLSVREGDGRLELANAH